MRRTRSVHLLTAGLLVLGVGWVLAPAGVPLFDGVNFPDEPYRYVAPGPGQQTAKLPSVATVAAPMTQGTNPQGFEVSSAEMAPQVSIYVPAGALQPMSTVATVDVTAAPVAPAGAAPADGPISGNVYRVTATATRQRVALADNTAGTITLRAPIGFKVIPELDFRPTPTAAWSTLQTSKIGNDNFEAPFEQLGDYAVVLPIHGRSARAGIGHTVVVVLAVVLGVAVIALLIVRGVRTISTAGDGLGEYDDDDPAATGPANDIDGGGIDGDDIDGDADDSDR